jgi:hypothetical protein
MPYETNDSDHVCFWISATSRLSKGGIIMRVKRAATDFKLEPAGMEERHHPTSIPQISAMALETKS